MQGYLDELQRRREMLKKCISRAEKGMPRDIHGRLAISIKGKKPYYYHVSKKTGKTGVYISKKNNRFAQDLATKSYLQKVLNRMKNEMGILDRYLELLTKKNAEDVYSGFSTSRKALVKPLLVSDELCAQIWEREPFQQSTFMPEMKIYPTKKGDMVRSKSEVLFADLYSDLGIPYRYEEVITLHDGTIMTPDFTLWDKKRRRVIYHEHFGKMDDPLYRKKNLKKIDDYRRNGIYSGKNLIMTFEGDGTILNMREMRVMIEDLMK